jgi:hypothetical protein
MGFVVNGTRAEAVPEVLVVLVVEVGGLGVDTALGIRGAADAKGAWLIRCESRGATVACKVALLEDLNQFVLAVALDGARIADTGRIIGWICIGGRRVACEAGKNVLSKGAKLLGTILDALQIM